jgi:flagellar biosynthesis chaperone FliJ
MAEASARIASAKEHTQKVLQERDSELEKIDVQRDAFETRIQELERERDELEHRLDSMARAVMAPSESPPSNRTKYLNQRTSVNVDRRKSIQKNVEAKANANISARRPMTFSKSQVMRVPMIAAKYVRLLNQGR